MTKPWYPGPGDLADTVADYLEGVTVAGWELREAVVARLTTMETELHTLESALHGTERAVIVSHGVLLTAWIDHAIGLDDAFRVLVEPAPPRRLGTQRRHEVRRADRLVMIRSSRYCK